MQLQGIGHCGNKSGGSEETSVLSDDGGDERRGCTRSPSSFFFFPVQCKEGERLWFAEGQLLFLSESVEKLLVGFAEISPDKEQNKVYNSV